MVKILKKIINTFNWPRIAVAFALFGFWYFVLKALVTIAYYERL